MEVEGLTDELKATKRELEVASQALLEARQELAVTKEILETLGGEGDPSGEGHTSEVSCQVEELQGRLDEADDLADRTQWQLGEIQLNQFKFCDNAVLWVQYPRENAACLC